MTNWQRVYGGVDTHLDVHVAAVVDETGAVRGTRSFPTTPLGLRRLQRWLAGHGHQGRRLNRGGDRQANSALHRIVIVRMSHHDPRTMDFIARRTAAGRSKGDSIRCLKRHLAREVYQRLQHPEPVTGQKALRPQRLALGLPLRAAAEQLHRPINAVARLENGTVHDPELAQRYHHWLTTQATA